MVLDHGDDFSAVEFAQRFDHQGRAGLGKALRKLWRGFVGADAESALQQNRAAVQPGINLHGSETRTHLPCKLMPGWTAARFCCSALSASICMVVRPVHISPLTMAQFTGEMCTGLTTM